MEVVIDIRLALESLGSSWAFGGSVTDGTRTAWEAVTWEDARPKPTWEALCAVPQPPEFDVPVGEVDTLIRMMPTIGWEILARMGIE